MTLLILFSQQKDASCEKKSLVKESVKNRLNQRIHEKHSKSMNWSKNRITWIILGKTRFSQKYSVILFFTKTFELSCFLPILFVNLFSMDSSAKSFFYIFFDLSCFFTNSLT